MSDEIRNIDNIIPAIRPPDNQIESELSSQEFQRRLYSWFEEQGLLSDLRARLRVQMINVLKGTALGPTVSGQIRQSVSPKIQAVNLLIAECLLHQNCHYTLSVFSIEEPMVSVLPEMNNSVMHGASKAQSGSLHTWRFAENDVFDILETLGIGTVTEGGAEIFDQYFDKNSTECLLMCIIRSLPKNIRGQGVRVDRKVSGTIAGGCNDTVTVKTGE